MELGFLEEVNVRELWKHEQYDFSNWLAKEKSMELLGDVLGLTLTDVDKEVYVGSYRCDLVAKDEATGIKVIIENQLEASNHDHLGKLITYASGLNATVIVWIVTQAREEHRSAIEWLNNNTNENLSFFLLELHAYKIGNSLPAPKFETIEKPNGFIKSSKGNAGSGDTAKGEAEAQRLEFWTQFNEVLVANDKPFNLRKATTDHWYNVAIGTSQASISINLVNKESSVVVELYINDNKSLFDRLLAQKDEIEQQLGFAMDWRRLDNRKASRILHRIDGLNFADHSNYPALMDEIIRKTVIMRKVFATFI
jgi:hypothetical protein